MRPRGLTPQQIVTFYSERDEDGCLLWTGHIDRDGYGRTSYRGNVLDPALMLWRAECGEVPAGFVVQHLCHSSATRSGSCMTSVCKHKRCIEMDHLLAVPREEAQLESQIFLDNAARWRIRHPKMDPWWGLD